ncbi:alpha/beta hydrolase [Paludibacterium yongneupense]|uniref:alpha/beta hydrolase n=1 Tax=Paludibacterium yongneupense TaxID=400061 RepID=UPI00040A9C47|nr:dienelactone hydrolase family protein [Paludibacterium yongneupense]
MKWQRFDQGWRLRPAASQAGSLVVLLHGVGSDGRDLLPLAEAWEESLPGAAFASFDGGEPFDGGGDARQWFSLAGVSPANRGQRVAQAYPALARRLQDELAFWQVPPERLALVGFSQGSIMAMHHLAVASAPLGAVVAYSGRLASAIAAPGRAPLTLVHGSDDSTIPVAESRAAQAAFQAAGFPVHFFEIDGLGHGISADGAARGLQALQQALGEQGGA